MGNDQQVIEIFHLMFIKALENKIPRSLFVLKGGCNLRFFFQSIRYSEDIDFDITTISRETLQKNVNKLLESIPFQRILFAKTLEIVNLSQPKQTDTTQRWKLGLRLTNAQRILSTKIEFSRRKMDEGVLFEPVNSEIISQYHLQPTLCSHYTRETAFYQKVNALIYRTETQARDIFDLYLLSTGRLNVSEIPYISNDDFSKAIEHAYSVSFSDYRGQVVSFLMPEYQEYYGTDTVWNEILQKVIELLQELSGNFPENQS